MPLSDETMALLEAAKATLDLSGRPKPRRQPAATGPELKAGSIHPETGEVVTGVQELRAREKIVRQQIADETDTEFLYTISFADPAARAEFLTALGLDPTARRLPGPAFHAAAAARPRVPLTVEDLAGLNHPPFAENPVPDPLADLPQTDDLPADALAEMQVLLAALLKVDGTWRGTDVRKSPHWVAVYYKTRAAKEQSLAELGADPLGDKYLDGHRFARLLGITLHTRHERSDR